MRIQDDIIDTVLDSNRCIEIGSLIKKLRKQRGLTGVQLGQRAGISQPKISKLESGQPPFKRDDIVNILNILKAPKPLRQQVEACFRLLQPGSQSHMRHVIRFTPSLAHYERAASTIRYITYSLMPAIFQTIAYRTAILNRIELSPDSIRSEMRATIQRQDMMWDPGRRYEILIHEIALYNVVTSGPDHLKQLDRLERMMHAPNVSVGIIPVKALSTHYAFCSFIVFDNSAVILELPDMDLMNRKAQSVETHIQMFTELTNVAYYDEDALQLIKQAGSYVLSRGTLEQAGIDGLARNS